VATSLVLTVLLRQALPVHGLDVALAAVTGLDPAAPAPGRCVLTPPANHGGQSTRGAIQSSPQSEQIRRRLPSEGSSGVTAPRRTTDNAPLPPAPARVRQHGPFAATVARLAGRARRAGAECERHRPRRLARRCAGINAAIVATLFASSVSTVGSALAAASRASSPSSDACSRESAESLESLRQRRIEKCSRRDQTARRCVRRARHLARRHRRPRPCAGWPAQSGSPAPHPCFFQLLQRRELDSTAAAAGRFMFTSGRPQTRTLPCRPGRQ
jgi:hypothetical protein